MTQHEAHASLAQRLAALTDREQEILGLIGRGLSLPEIADQLHRSQKTIQTHRLALGRKLGVSNRVELARIAYIAGLAPLEPNQEADNLETNQQARGKLPHSGPAWEALQRIDEVIAASYGPSYMRELPMALASILGVKSAGISELIQDDQSLRCVTWYQDGLLQDEIVYDLAGTPCHTTMIGGAIAIEENLQESYPEDCHLKKEGITAYMGVRLDFQSQPIGVLWLLNDRPFDRSTEPLTILQICASRAAAEVRRQRDFEALREMAEAAHTTPELPTPRKATLRRRANGGLNTGLPGVCCETLVEALPEGIAILDAEGRICYANPCYLEMLGIDSDQALGRSPADFMTQAEAARFLEMTPKRRIGTLGRYRTTFRRSDQSLIDALVSSRPAYDEDGRYLGAFAIISKIE